MAVIMRWRSGVIVQSSANDPDRIASSVVDAVASTGNSVPQARNSMRLAPDQ
jgi:hypothetical protein